MSIASNGMGLGQCYSYIQKGSYTKNSNKAKTVSAVRPMKKKKKSGKKGK